MSGYLDYSGRDDMLSGGARRIPVRTPAGEHQVWVKRVGNHPDLRVLLLQVRRALGLDRDNFVLLGHSWGGLLATEYALHYFNGVIGFLHDLAQPPQG